MKTITLALLPTTDPELYCIVCRRTKVELEVAYRTMYGRSAQGIHSACVSRAESLAKQQREQPPALPECIEIWKNAAGRWVQCGLREGHNGGCFPKKETR